MDLVGKLKSNDRYHYILTITDAFTHLIELVPIKDKESLTMAEALLDNWICRHGYYSQVVSDRGGEFISGVMKELQNLMCMKHHIISPFSPQINGIIEQAHRSLGEYIRSYCEESTTGWVKFLPSLRFALNTRIHSRTKVSLFFMTYLVHLVFPRTPEENITYSKSDIVKMLQYARQLVTDNSETRRQPPKEHTTSNQNLRISE